MPWLWNYPRGQTHCPLATPVGLKDQRGQRIWGHKETPVTGKGVWGRTDACICVWLSPSAVHPKLLQHCLLISLTPIQNKKFKKREIPFMPNSRMQFFSCFFVFFFNLLATPSSMWDLSSPARDGAPNLYIGSAESQSLESQRSPEDGCVDFVLLRWPCHVARGIFPDQGLNPCPLHWEHRVNHRTTKDV